MIEGLNFNVTGNAGRANTYNVIKVSGTADSPVSNVTLRDVTIDCGNGAAKGINFHFTENAVIENVTVKGTPANDSLAIAESTGLVIRNCNFATGAWGYAVQINWDNNESYINGCNVIFDGIENIPSIYVTDSIWTGAEYKEVPNGHIISGLDKYEAISITTPEKEEGRFFVPAATDAESLEALNYAISIMHQRIFNGINGALANVGTAYSWTDNPERGSMTVKDAPVVDDNSIAMDIELAGFQYSYTSLLKTDCYTMTGDIQLTLTGTKSGNSFTVTGWEVKSAGVQLEGDSGSAVAAIESIKGGFEPALVLQKDNSTWSITNPTVAKFSTNDLSCRAVFNGKAMVLEGNFPL